MSKGEHHFYFSSKHSIHNNRGTFTVNLPFPLQFDGEWKCAIFDLFISDSHQPSPIYLLTDFCETSFVQGDKQLPILRKVYLEENKDYYSFTNLVYIPLKQNHLTNFSISFLDSNLERVVFNNSTFIECNIHFYKDE
jgi:hypothetical protein